MEERDKSPLAGKLEELFGIDLRSLALFRIGLGLVILGDLISRSFDLRAFYSDFGVLPRAALLDSKPLLSLLSPYFLHGSVFFQACLFFLTGIFALALVLGYRSRLATFACWFLMTSLHLRNPLIHQSGDILLHLCLFWGLFLPLGARLSIDQARDKSERILPRRVLSGGSTALLLQIFFVYLFSAINKTGEAWRDGSALYDVLSLDSLATSFGHSLLAYPELLKSLTHFTFWLECLGPLLVFLPFFTKIFRTAIVFLFVAFHLGMIFCLNLGTFPYICIVAWLVFLPSEFWDRIWKASRSAGGLTIKAHWLANGFAFLLIAYILLWNLGSMNVLINYRPLFIRQYQGVGDFFRITQAWGMFAPAPAKEDGRIFIQGHLQDGSEVEVYGGGMPKVRWRKYLDWIVLDLAADKRSYYGRYLCQEWNLRQAEDKKVKMLSIYFIREKILPNNRNSLPEKALLWEQDCSQ